MAATATPWLARLTQRYGEPVDVLASFRDDLDGFPGIRDLCGLYLWRAAIQGDQLTAIESAIKPTTADIQKEMGITKVKVGDAYKTFQATGSVLGLGPPANARFVCLVALQTCLLGTHGAR